MATKFDLEQLELARQATCEAAKVLENALVPFYSLLPVEPTKNIEETGVSEMLKIAKRIIEFAKEVNNES